MSNQTTTKAFKNQAKAGCGDFHSDPIMVANHALDDKKGEDIKVIKLTNAYTDNLIIATGTSERHVQSLADNVQDELRRAGYVIDAVEGIPNNHWVLVDCGDFVVHVFLKDVRELYNLEKLWSYDIDENAETQTEVQAEAQAQAKTIIA